jgi:hypothetical protein
LKLLSGRRVGLTFGSRLGSLEVSPAEGAAAAPASSYTELTSVQGRPGQGRGHRDPMRFFFSPLSESAAGRHAELSVVLKLSAKISLSCVAHHALLGQCSAVSASWILTHFD